MKPTNPPLITSFERWVAENNIPTTFEYSKDWWDYAELVQRFARKFDVSDVTVVGHYVVSTPPPEEQLPMPAVALVGAGVTVAMKWDFGAACRKTSRRSCGSCSTSRERSAPRPFSSSGPERRPRSPGGGAA